VRCHRIRVLKPRLVDEYEPDDVGRREYDLDSLERASDLPIGHPLELQEQAVGARVVAEVPNLIL
jgi:hypothetical protein